MIPELPDRITSPDTQVQFDQILRMVFKSIIITTFSWSVHEDYYL